MSAEFLDSNIVLYLLRDEPPKADRTKQLLAAGPTISVQVLNEVASVCRRKLRLDYDVIGAFLDDIRALAEVRPLTIETHDTALRIADRYALSFYDAMIVAAALEAGCEKLWSEDMHSGLVIEGRLVILDPFKAGLA